MIPKWTIHPCAEPQQGPCIDLPKANFPLGGGAGDGAVVVDAVTLLNRVVSGQGLGLKGQGLG